MRIRGLREVFLASSALIALGTAAEAQFVTTVANVPGTILDSDGARIFYRPDANPNAPTLFDIATNTNTVVCNSCSVTNGFVTPKGAIFLTDSSAQLYNGTLSTLVTGDPRYGVVADDLIVAGKYAAYYSSKEGTVLLNTTDGTKIVMHSGMNPFPGGLTTDGKFVGGAASGPGYADTYFFDGITTTKITNAPTGPAGPGQSQGYGAAETDGKSFLYIHWHYSFVQMNAYDRDLIYNNPATGTTKLLATFRNTSNISYQIGNGWVAYRDPDGDLILLSPSGTSSDFGAIDGLVTLGADGSVVYKKSGALYLHEASGATMTIGGGYSRAFQVGTQWYFIGGGQLSAINSLLTYLNPSFSAASGTFNAADGAVLMGTSDFTTSRPIAMAGSTSLYTNSSTIELSGVVSGPGSLIKLDMGRLILSGNNTYTGGTRINVGTLQIGNGGTTGSVAGDIVDNGSLIFDRSDTTIYGGTISGTGAVMQIGTGTTILTGTNTYTGPTTISAGTLQIGNGGTTGSIAGDVINNATLVFNRSDTYTLAGTIFGLGPVKQIGSGTLILNGVNSYGGGTTVAAGSLMVGDAAHPGAQLSSDVVVAAGAHLLGHGRITGRVTNSGTVAPGGSIGSLMVGLYNQAAGGTLKIEIDPTAASSLHVNGPASLDGTIALDFQSGSYGTRAYTILDSASVSGSFVAVATNNAPAGEFYGVQYTPNTVNLVVEPTRNAQIYSDFQRNSFDAAERLNAMAFSHVETQYCREADAKPGRSRETECSEISFWMQPFGGAGGYKDANGLDEYSARWAGVMGGFDFHTEMGFALNIATAYARNTLSISGGSGRATTDTFYLSLDGGIPLFEGKLDINGHWILNNGNARRALNLDTGGSLTATSTPKNKMFGGAVQYAHPVFSEDLTAAARLTYTASKLSAFEESGGQSFNLAINGKTVSSFYSDLRLRYGHVYQMKSGALFIPELSGGVRAILGDTAHDIDASLMGGQSNLVAVPGTQDRFAFVASAGFKAQKDGWFSLYTRADTRISAHAQEGEITAGVSVDF